jgi:hypothetical protein
LGIEKNPTLSRSLIYSSLFLRGKENNGVNAVFSYKNDCIFRLCPGYIIDHQFKCSLYWAGLKITTIRKSSIGKPPQHAGGALGIPKSVNISCHCT